MNKIKTIISYFFNSWYFDGIKEVKRDNNFELYDIYDTFIFYRKTLSNNKTIYKKVKL